jgi:hypothetical protein
VLATFEYVTDNYASQTTRDRLYFFHAFNLQTGAGQHFADGAWFDING